MFVDKVRIFITAGRGGDGCISFRREKYEPMGGPNGGNGGQGGDVYLVADPHLTTLLDFSYKPHFKASSGLPGQGSDKYGKSGEDLIIRVPVGTVIFKGDKLVTDLHEKGQRILVAKGGRGGRGNAAFKTSRNTAPKISEKGELGDIVTLDLELRLIADVGLVGFPNAGKSTLLSRISAARPKIADYPFTTLSPNLGVVNHKGKSFVVADIPGLIEGAHHGKGLGDEFLRHIQRTKVLIHIVDLFGFEEKTAYQNYTAINKELKSYAEQLAKKPMLVVANKTDLTGADKKLSEFKKHLKRKKILPISAASGKGMGELLNAVVSMLQKAPVEDVHFEPVKEYIYTPEFSVSREAGAFVVSGEKIERLAQMTKFDQEESLLRFHKILKKMGIDDALEEKGIADGDPVRIGKQEFTYER